MVVVGTVVVAYLFWTGAGPLPDPEGCTAEVGGVTVDLDTEQAENATTIAAVAVRRGMPARAVSIALATAFQESKLRNVDRGDRDSVGLFQQRPSQGWGTREQILDPYYAANQFYDALEKVDGYESMRITEAAQRVQRSGYPEAYEAHAQRARALASALTGYSPAKFSCVVHAEKLSRQTPDAAGLTPRAEAVRRDLTKAFGTLSWGLGPGGDTGGDAEHDPGQVVDVVLRPVTAEHRRQGWVVASYLVAHAKRLGIEQVVFDGRIWTSGRASEQGWRAYDPPSGPGNLALREHRDHIQVDVG